LIRGDAFESGEHEAHELVFAGGVRRHESLIQTLAGSADIKARWETRGQ
jgi:hypothetical protein